MVKGKSTEKFLRKGAPIIIVLILIIICGVSIRSGIIKSYENKELKEKIEEMERKRMAVDSIREEVKKISRYTAYEFNYTQVIMFSDQNEFKGIKIPLTGNQFIATIDGKMNIGIDGEKVEFEEVPDSEGEVARVKLLVPHSEILDNYTIQESLEIYDETSNIFNPVKVSDYSELLVEAENKQEKKVREGDVLQKSDEAVKNLLISYFEALYGEEVEIEYEYLGEEEQ